MPSYQKIQREGNMVTFRVICDPTEKGAVPHEETVTYCLGTKGYEDETEQQLMSRVAHHVSDSFKVVSEPAEEKVSETPEKVVKAIAKDKLPYVEEKAVTAE